MAPSLRKPKAAARPISKGEREGISEPTKSKIKSSQKRKGNKLLLVGIFAIVFVIFAVFLVDKADIFSVAKRKRKYSFVKIPVPEFDINRGIERRSNLSLDEFAKIYDAKWLVSL